MTVDPQPPEHDEGGPPSRRAQAELDHDRWVERMLVWKGLAALVLVLLVVYVRQRYLL